MKRAGFFRALSPAGRDRRDRGRRSRACSTPEGRLPLVVGRFVVREASRPEIAAAVETAFALAGSLEAASRGACGSSGAASTARAAAAEFRDPTPPLFAFNSPLGACPACQGFGRVIGVDLEKVIPDRTLTLDERPVAPWNTPAYESAYDDLFRACRRYSVRTDVPVSRLSAHEREVLIEGRGDFYGVQGFFDWLETKRYKIHVRVLLARYRAYTLCADCRGARLAPPALWVRFRGRTIAELAELPLSELQALVRRSSTLSPAEEERLASVVAELRARVRYMNDVGLEYLTLSRAGADALGRRGAAHRPRLGARRRADRHALRPRRADDRPARRRHAPPARRSCGGWPTAATRSSSSSTTRRRSRRRTT